jgi:hypothetical protein
MNSLCEAVESEIAKAFHGKWTAWETSSEGPNSCNVCTKAVLINFTLDPLNQLVSSSMTFSEVAKEYKENLYSHIIVKLFPYIAWEDGLYVNDLDRRIALEVKNINNILEAIENSNISPRDLLYFYLGYNAGYTDYS